MISTFLGPNYFLSNFSPSLVEYEGHKYPTVEHAYQAAKTENKVARKVFQSPSSLTAGQAKRLGQTLDLRPGWEGMKVGVMYQILKSKFEDTNLRLKLLGTGTQELVEGNDWGDVFWGVCEGVGENYLGKCLMKVRDEIGNQLEEAETGRVPL